MMKVGWWSLALVALMVGGAAGSPEASLDAEPAEPVVLPQAAPEEPVENKILLPSESGEDEPEDLRALQNTVREVAADIDTMHETAKDDEADAAATGDVGDAAPTLLPQKPKPTRLDELEDADTASDRRIAQLDADTAAVQAEDTRNDLEQQAAYESDEVADENDAQQAYDLANNLKQTDLLPEGWVEKTDLKTGKCYYENVAAKKTTWDPPRSLVSIALAAARGQRDAQTELQSLKMKMEAMTSKDLGESGSVGAGCAGAQQAVEKAAVSHLKDVFADLEEALKLTPEQKKLLAAYTKKEVKIPLIIQPTADHSKIKEEVELEPKNKPAKEQAKAKKDTKAKQPVKKEVSTEQQEDAKDQIAMAEAETRAQAAARKVAEKEAARLHARDKNLRQQVKDAAKKKDQELAKQDKELMEASQETDKLTAKVMSPKATPAERREEKMLLGEAGPTSLDDDDHDALEFGVPQDKFEED